MTEQSNPSERTSMAGAAAYDSPGAPFGRLWWNWPLTRLHLDREGGSLKGNEEYVPAFALALLAAGAPRPDVRFRWEEVEKVELTERKFAYFGNRGIRFVFARAAQGVQGLENFEFYPLSEHREERILDFARAQGATVVQPG